jgi:hypothetical protein
MNGEKESTICQLKIALASLTAAIDLRDNECANQLAIKVQTLTRQLILIDQQEKEHQ